MCFYAKQEQLPQKKLVAFGDSLTFGMVGGRRFGLFTEEAPYTEYLAPLLGKNWILLNKGVNGDLTSQMLKRFNNDVISQKPDIVVILGGTNDIGLGIDTKTVISNLKIMIQKALDAGITPVTCAIPSLVGFYGFIAPREEVNKAISLFAKEKGLQYVDLFRGTADTNKQLSEKYSSDGLHFNKEGYKLMAKLIYEQGLKSIGR